MFRLLRSYKIPGGALTIETSIDELVADAERFLAHWPRKPAPRTGFRWGEGSDDVSIFEEQDSDVDGGWLTTLRDYRVRLADAGFAWIAGPTDYGGRGLSHRHQRAFDEVSRRYEVPSNAPLTIGLGMVAPTILAHATEVAKRRYLWAIRTAEVIGCQLFSEPSAGSDLAGVITRADRDGDQWRLTGQKVWTSGAHHADIGLALCRTSDGPRHHNLTAFVVDMHAEGVEVRPLRQMTGTAAFNEVFLDGVRVAEEMRVGEVDAGWRVALTTLTNERNAIGDTGTAGKGVLSTDRVIALLRHLDRSSDAVLRQRAARLVSGMRTSMWTRRRFAANGRIGAEASMLKLALTRDVGELTSLVSTALGPRLAADTGEWGTFAWNDVVLGVPGFRIGGGTDEVLKNVVAERVLGLPKEPA